jgi:transposase
MEAREGTPCYQRFVGVDIAAATATVAWQAAGGPAIRPCTIAQSRHGFAALERRLRATPPAPAPIPVVMAATGSSWLSRATALADAGFAVSVITAAQAHHVAQALLKRAKTAASDARTLAPLAALLQPACWTPPPAIPEERRQRLAQREARIAVRQPVRNHVHALIQGPRVIATVRARMDRLIATLDGQSAAVAAALAAVVAQDTGWTDAIRRLQTMPGVGLLTAAWLVVGTRNCTRCATAEQATADAGLAPMPRESGSRRHGRATIGRGGNGRLRTALSMATLSAAQHNPVIKPFSRRLRDAGKPKQVARCAAARKLLPLAWAVGTKHQPFDPAYQQQQHEALPQLAA